MIGPKEIYFKMKIIVMFRSLLIFLSPGKFITCSDPGHRLSFLLGSFKLSDKLSLDQKTNLSSIKRKTAATMGWVYVDNTKLW